MKRLMVTMTAKSEMRMSRKANISMKPTSWRRGRTLVIEVVVRRATPRVEVLDDGELVKMMYRSRLALLVPKKEKI